jgi:hypothetical protein
MVSSSSRRQFPKIIGFIASFGLFVQIAFAASVGPTTSTTATSISNGGVAWSSKTVTVPAGQHPDLINLAGYGFNIPAGSTIDGIAVTVQLGRDRGDIALVQRWQLMYAGATLGTGISVSEAITSPGLGDHTAGSSSSLWGATLTPEIVNSASFGFSPVITSSFYDDVYTVGTATMTVYYKQPPTVTMTAGWRSCTGANCPEDWGNCGYGVAPANGTYTMNIDFSEVMRAGDFTLGDISIPGATPSNLQTSDNQHYTVDITSSSTNALLEVSIADAAARSNATGAWSSPTGPLYIPWGEYYWYLCDGMVIDYIYWKLDETTGTTVDSYDDIGCGVGGAVACAGHPGEIKNSSGDWGYCGAGGTALQLDGQNDYVTSALWAPSFLRSYSIWVKSNTPSPSSQAILQVAEQHGYPVLPFLTIMYRSGVQNYLYVAHGSDAVRSRKAFDITQWNHIQVIVDPNTNTIVSLKVNDQDVMSEHFQSDIPAVSRSDTNNVYVGARMTTSGPTDYFNGLVDEFSAFYQEDPPVVTPGTCGSRYRIDPLPGKSYTLVNIDDTVDLRVVGKPSGNYSARLSKNGIVIIDAVVALTQNRSWGSIYADVSGSKVAVNFPAAQLSTHGHDASENPHTIYAVKSMTNVFRVCPNALTVADVSSGCAGGVLFSGPYPQTQSVGSDTVTVGIATFAGVSYWYASGLTGSGGEGENGAGGDAVPFFSWWTLPLVLAGCVIFLRREEHLFRHRFS